MKTRITAKTVLQVLLLLIIGTMSIAILFAIGARIGNSWAYSFICVF